jgi:hypothetical protein
MKDNHLKWLSVLIILITGIVHLLMVGQEYEEVPYMGILFGINFVAALIAAAGIYRKQDWGWLLGAAVAVGSMLGYILSRTVGLPGMEIEAWLQPLGVISLLAEGAFILLTVRKQPWGSLARVR